MPSLLTLRAMPENSRPASYDEIVKNHSLCDGAVAELNGLVEDELHDLLCETTTAALSLAHSSGRTHTTTICKCVHALLTLPAACARRSVCCAQARPSPARRSSGPSYA